jgi:hypothetical protein
MASQARPIVRSIGPTAAAMETKMTLQLVFDGALAAAELLALLFAAPATAREPIPIEQPVQLHRLTSSLDDFPLAGRARLSEDERIADAFRPAPGAQTVAATMAARPPRRDEWNCRATLPVQVDQRPAVPARGAE